MAKRSAVIGIGRPGPPCRRPMGDQAPLAVAAFTDTPRTFAGILGMYPGVRVTSFAA